MSIYYLMLQSKPRLNHLLPQPKCLKDRVIRLNR